MDEFMKLKPYMLKEMVRVSQLAHINRSRGLPYETNSIWLKKAKVELAECGVLAEGDTGQISSMASNTSGDIQDSQDTTAFQKTTKTIVPGSPDSRSSCDSMEASQCPSEIPASTRKTLNWNIQEHAEQPGEQVLLPRASVVSKSSQMHAISKRTMSIYVFRNADRSNSGQAVFMARIPPTIEALLQICSDTIRPVVGPAECLMDVDLRPVRSMDEVYKGGTYLLKGKEALDPPPHMFAHRPPVTTPSLRCLSEIQIAAHAEAKSRPCTSSTRPLTSQASFMGGFSEGSTSSISLGRVGSPPQNSVMSSLSTEPSRTLPHKENWQVEVRLNKHLTYGGKNLPPTHRRYDLWTVMPRHASEPSIGLHSQHSHIDSMHSPVCY